MKAFVSLFHGLKRCMVLLWVCHFSYSALAIPIAGPDGERRQLINYYGPTQKSDTLWMIAERARPAKTVTMYQVMLAIFFENRHAFATDNINSLEPNKMLVIPDIKEMEAVSPKEAYRRTMRDYRSWRAKKRAKQAKIKKKKGIITANYKPKGDELVEETYIRKDGTGFVLRKNADGEVVSKMAVDLNPSLALKQGKWIMLDGEQAKKVNVKLLDEGASRLLLELKEEQERNDLLNEQLLRVEDELELSSVENRELIRRIAEFNNKLTHAEEKAKSSKEKEEDFQDEIQDLTTTLEKERNTNLELQKKQEQMAAQKKLEEKGFWSQVLNNPLYMGILIFCEVMLFLPILGWIYRRNAIPPPSQRPDSSSDMSTTAFMPIDDGPNAQPNLGSIKPEGEGENKDEQPPKQEQPKAPTAQTAAEAAPEPVAEAAPEPVAEAAPEPVAEAAPEPVAEAAPEPVAEAAPEPVAQQDDAGWGDALNEQAETEAQQDDAGWGDALNEQAETEAQQDDAGWGDALNEQAETEAQQDDAGWGDALNEQAETEAQQDDAGWGDALNEQAETEAQQDEAASSEATDLQEVAENVSETMEELSEAANEITDVVDEGLEEAHEVADELAEVADELTDVVDEGLEEAHEVADELAEVADELTDVVDEGLEEAHEVADELAEVADELTDVVDEGLEEAHEVADELAEVADEITDVVDEGLEEAHEVADELAEVADEVTDSLDEIVEEMTELVTEVVEEVEEVVESIEESVDLESDLSLVEAGKQEEKKFQVNDEYEELSENQIEDTPEAETQAEPEAEAQAEPEAEAQAEPEAEAQAEPEAEAQAEPEAEVQAEPEAEAKSESVDIPHVSELLNQEQEDPQPFTEVDYDAGPIDLEDHQLDEILSRMKLPNFSPDELLTPEQYDTLKIKEREQRAQSRDSFTDDPNMDAEYINIGSLLKNTDKQKASKESSFTPTESVKSEHDELVAEAENLVTAKLDLVNAYIEIDDKESAQTLLEDILQKGNDQQKEEAQRLLKTLAEQEKT